MKLEEILDKTEGIEEIKPENQYIFKFPKGTSQERLETLKQAFIDKNISDQIIIITADFEVIEIGDK